MTSPDESGIDVSRWQPADPNLAHRYQELLELAIRQNRPRSAAVVNGEPIPGTRAGRPAIYNPVRNPDPLILPAGTNGVVTYNNHQWVVRNWNPNGPNILREVGNTYNEVRVENVPADYPVDDNLVDHGDMPDLRAEWGTAAESWTRVVNRIVTGEEAIDVQTHDLLIQEDRIVRPEAVEPGNFFQHYPGEPVAGTPDAHVVEEDGGDE